MFRRAKAEEEKKKQEVAERWRKLAKRLLLKDYIDKKYKQGRAPGGSAEKEKESEKGKEKEKEQENTERDANNTTTSDWGTSEHSHIFEEEECVDKDKDLWRKRCSLCKLVVTFEKM